MEFVEVLVRQAHPGPRVPPYSRFEQKLRDAYRYRQDEHIPWTVLVDDVEGHVHQKYGGLPTPSYLIDREGRVSFYNLWTHAPTLRQAVESLIAQGETGIVEGGTDRGLHMAAGMTRGWPALERGRMQSLSDLMIAMPGSPLAFWLGYKLRPLLAPLTQRDRPLSLPVKAALIAGGAALFLGAWRLGQSARQT